MNEAITYRKLTGNELYYDILSTRDRLRLKYLSSGFMDINDETNIVAFCGETLVGVMGLRESPHEKDVLWMLFVSVDSDYQNQGIATNLVAMLYDHCAYHDKRVKISRYSDVGERFLKPVFEKFAKEYPNVETKDGDDDSAFTPR